MRYLLPDNVAVEGETADDILRAMGARKFSPSRSLTRYRRRMAGRIESMYGALPPHSTSQELLDAMEQLNLVERLDA